MKILIYLTPELLEAIKDTCKQQNYERSEFIRSCIRDRVYSTNKQLPKKIQEDIAKVDSKAQEVRIKTAQLLKSPLKKVFGAFDICPKHKSFYSSCGC